MIHLASFRGGELNHCAPAGNSGTSSPPPLLSTLSMKRLNAAARSVCSRLRPAVGEGLGSSALSSAFGLAKDMACRHGPGP